MNQVVSLEREEQLGDMVEIIKINTGKIILIADVSDDLLGDTIISPITAIDYQRDTRNLCVNVVSFFTIIVANNWPPPRNIPYLSLTNMNEKLNLFSVKLSALLCARAL